MSTVSADQVPWLHQFGCSDVAPGQSLPVATRGRCALVLVLDGVLAIEPGVAGLNRALPGEALLVRGEENLDLVNGSRRNALCVCLAVFKDDVAASPSRQLRYFADDERAGALCTVAAGDGRRDALSHEGAVCAKVTSLAPRETVIGDIDDGAQAVVCVLQGTASVNQCDLAAGECVLISQEREMRISGIQDAQVLVLEHGQAPSM